MSLDFTRMDANLDDGGFSKFDWSFNKHFDFDMGQMIPVVCEDIPPASVISFGNQVMIRFMPMVAPIMHSIKAYVHYFFVPYRILYKDLIGENSDNWSEAAGFWESFITGGRLNDFNTPLPRWFDNSQGLHVYDPDKCSKYSLWDYLGFPVGDWSSVPRARMPIDAPRRAYNLIYNEHYRDQDIQPVRSQYDSSIWSRNWEFDYFTSCKPFRQRGTPPAIETGTRFIEEAWFPLIMRYNADIFNSDGSNIFSSVDLFKGVSQLQTSSDSAPSFNRSVSSRGSLMNPSDLLVTNGGLGPDGQPTSMVQKPFFDFFGPANNLGINAWLSNVNYSDIDRMVIDSYYVTRIDPSQLISSLGTLDVSTLRAAVQLQKWQERNARAGVRLVEFLKAHYNTDLPDSTAQRPIYLGGSVQPIVISEVLQTSETTGESALGTMAGHGLSTGKDYIGSYRALEHGVFMGLLSVMPDPAYFQGMPRQWIKQDRYDFYFREFAHLSEQPVYDDELFFANTSEDKSEVFGYQPIYQYMRFKSSMICGAIRDTLDYWSLYRKFGSKPALNSDFLTLDGTSSDMKRIFQEQTEPSLIAFVRNDIDAVLPLPYSGEPGFVDHF